MGRVRRGPPKDLIKMVQREFSLSLFIETGTFYGSTATWASEHFDLVTTIELDDRIYEEVTSEYNDVNDIQFINGKSQEQLQEIVEEVPSEGAIYWLDAHYSGEGTAGDDYECPLIEELRAIGSSNHEAFVFIDDARLFLSPPPQDHSPKDWPAIDEVIKALKTELGTDYYIVVVEDVIVAVPQKAKQMILEYARDVATEQASRSSVSEGFRLIWKGILGWFVSDTTISILRMSGLYPAGKKLYNAFD